MRIIDADKYRKDLLSTYDDVSMELEVLDRQPLISAIPILEGATNGEVVKTMFPDELLTSITSTLWWGDNMSFNKDWWNAPYKGNLSEKPAGSESEENE